MEDSKKEVLLSRIKELSAQLKKKQAEVDEEGDEQERDSLLTEIWDLELEILATEAKYKGVKKKFVYVDYDFDYEIPSEEKANSPTCWYCKSYDHVRNDCAELKRDVENRFRDAGKLYKDSSKLRAMELDKEHGKETDSMLSTLNVSDNSQIPQNNEIFPVWMKCIRGRSREKPIAQMRGGKSLVEEPKYGTLHLAALAQQYAFWIYHRWKLWFLKILPVPLDSRDVTHHPILPS